MAVVAKAHDIVNIHRVLAHSSEKITQITTTGRWGPREARLKVTAKRQVVQWVGGPDKTESNGVGDEALNVKPGEDEQVGKRGNP